jgi:multidrug transporter EmrE-like cation transporter
MAIEVPPPEALSETTPAYASLLGGGRAISLVLLLISIALAVIGQLTLKSAMDEVGRIGSEQIRTPVTTVLRVAREPKLWIGLAVFGLSSVFWLVVLSRVALSVAYPLVGLSYIVVVAMGRFVFHEDVPALRWVGVSVIAVGIAMIGLSWGRASG